MNFNLSDDATMVKDSAVRYLKDKSTGAAVKEMICSEEGYARNIWKEIAELGWLGYVYDEKYGGSSGSFLNLFIIFEQMGKYLLPSPFFPSCVLSGFLITEAGSDQMKSAWLPGVIRGEAVLTTALLDEEGNCDCDDPLLKAKETKEGRYAIDGVRILVPYVNIASDIIVCANVSGSPDGANGPTLFMVNKQSPGVQATLLNTMTEAKKYAVTFNHVECTRENVIGEFGKGSFYINKILPCAIALRCGEMLGGLERVCDMTVAYMKEREQFGGPLGRLEVVQHYCADLATYLETARLLAYQAAANLSAGRPGLQEVYMAKAWLSDCYKNATWIAHQLHGAVGFAAEHDLHLYYRHAKELELEFGDSTVFRQKVADEMGI